VAADRDIFLFCVNFFLAEFFSYGYGVRYEVPLSKMTPHVLSDRGQC